jgi:hypothetical protein
MIGKVNRGFYGVLFKDYLLSLLTKRRYHATNTTGGDMGYSKTINIPAAEDYAVVTALASTVKPYSWQLLDADGNDISNCIMSVLLVDTNWNVNVYSDTEYLNAQLLIVYQ